MPIGVSVWRIDGDKAVTVERSTLANEELLEKILEAEIGLLGLPNQLLVVGRPVRRRNLNRPGTARTGTSASARTHPETGRMRASSASCLPAEATGTAKHSRSSRKAVECS